MATYQAEGPTLNFSAVSPDPQSIPRVVALNNGGFGVTWIGQDDERTTFDGDVFGLTFGPDFTPTTTQAFTAVDNTGPGLSYPVNMSVTSLQAGGFALLSSDDTNYAANGSDNRTDVALRLYDATGHSIHSPVLLGHSGAFGTAVATLGNGSLVAEWTDDQGALRAQALSANGDLSGSSFVVAPAGSDFPTRPALAAVGQAGWVTTYVSNQTGEGHLVFYNGTGVASADKVIAQNVTNLQSVQVATLTDGDVVAAWASVDNNGQALQIHAQIYSASGDKVGNDILVSSNSSSAISLSSLADGGFAVALESRDANSVSLQTFNSIGQIAAAPVVVDHANSPSITSLTDGGMILAWKEPGGALHAQAFEPRTVQNDFNGDGHGDILWRNDNGSLTDWLGNADGSFTANDSVAYVGGIPASWKVAGVADFNGDGRNDILWRNDNGALTDWLGRANGSFAANDAHAYVGAIPTSWKVAGTGDFNGDGRADVLWRNDNGALTDWLGRADGSFAANDAHAYSTASTSWKVAGTGDFNGDGNTDVLWRNDNGALTDWLGHANGGFTANDAHAYNGSVSTGWKVAGTGDFNGDGHADILWRNDNGGLTDWLGRADGGFTANDQVAYTSAMSTSWKVDSVTDINGDGRADIVWRNDNGAMTDWLANANGSFTANDAHAFAQVPTSWHIQPDHFAIA